MKILLVSIAGNISYTPLALLYLKACLLNERYLKENTAVEIKEFALEDADDFILSQIQKFNPDIIGFSCYIWNIERILKLCLKIKQLSRKIKIILGGPQVCPIAKDVLENNSHIDIVVRGEGELTFMELSKTIIRKDRFDNVRGITYRRGERIISNPDREIIANLDSIPSAYLSNHIALKDREACLETQRGCPFRCHFCYYHKSFNKIRFFSLERVKKELIFLLKQKIKMIYLMDPVFNSNLERAKEICRFILKNNKDNIPFHTEIRAELVDNELAELFAKSNVRLLEIGLQSTRNRVLFLANRTLNIKKFINGINLLKKYNLDIEPQLILGLPGDTPRSFKKSLEFTLNLETPRLTVFRLQVLPGTEIWRRVKELGITYEDKPPYNFLQSKTMPFDYVIEQLKIIKNLNLFRTKKTIKFLCKEAKINLLDIIKLWIEWLNNDRFLLNYQNGKILKDKFRGFIEYFCNKNNIDYNFYNTLLKKEITLPKKARKIS
jgi:radical SAM superfamily enzyme YgiQ (UPF0313 family)